MYRKIKKKNNKKKQVDIFLAKVKKNVYICGVRKRDLYFICGIINAG
jgi:hypothetical protein